MGFITFFMGAFLATKAIVTAGIWPGILSILFWILFGFFLGIPPIIGLLSSWKLWETKEAFTGLAVQVILLAGALWIFEVIGLADLSVWFVAFSAINGFLMAPAMVKEKYEEVQKHKYEHLKSNLE